MLVWSLFSGTIQFAEANRKYQSSSSQHEGFQNAVEHPGAAPYAHNRKPVLEGINKKLNLIELNSSLSQSYMLIEKTLIKQKNKPVE